MTFFEFVLKSIKANIKKYYIFMSCIILSMTVFFMYATLWVNPDFKDKQTNQMETLLSVAGVVVVVFAVFIILYTNSLFLKSREKEFGVYISYGLVKKDLKKMIGIELMVIYTLCLIIAFLSGTVFSKLFFMISIKILSIDNVQFSMNSEAYLYTVAVFTFISWLALGISRRKISKSSQVDLQKSSLKSDYFKGKRSHSMIGFIGCLMIVVATLLVYIVTKNIGSEDVLNWKVLTLMGITLLGVYLFIRFFVLVLLLRVGSAQGVSFIANRSLGMHYISNTRMYFVITILSFSIILFSTVTFTLMDASYIMAENESMYTIEYQDLEAKPYEDIVNPRLVAEKLGIQDQVTVQQGSFLYLEAHNISFDTWKEFSFIPVMDVEVYNGLFHTKHQLENKKGCILIITESRLSNGASFFEDSVLLSEGEILIEQRYYEKVVDRYLFSQPLILLVDQATYHELYFKAENYQRANVHLINVENWLEHEAFSLAFRNDFLKLYDEIWSDDEELLKQVIQTSGYSMLNYLDKFRSYTWSKELGAFSLYIMSFISMTFMVSILITFYFSIFAESDYDRKQIKKLKGIGMTKKEIKKLVSIKIRKKVFIPTGLGSVLGVIWCYCMNFHRLMEIELDNGKILFQGLEFLAVFVMILIIYGMVLSREYTKKIYL